jgi:hypothetical protein
MLMQDISDFSRQIDAAQPDDEARTALRLGKIAEQAGEALGDYIRSQGRNIIKEDGEVSAEQVADRVLSVAFSALGVYEHLTGHRGAALDELAIKAREMREKAPR